MSTAPTFLQSILEWFTPTGRWERQRRRNRRSHIAYLRAHGDDIATQDYNTEDFVFLVGEEVTDDDGASPRSEPSKDADGESD